MLKLKLLKPSWGKKKMNMMYNFYSRCMKILFIVKQFFH